MIYSRPSQSVLSVSQTDVQCFVLWVPNRIGIIIYYNADNNDELDLGG